MSSDPPANETTPRGCEEGIRLAFRARDHGEWQPLAEWLVRNPRCAEEVAGFMGADGEILRAFTPAPAPARIGSVLGDYELCEEIGRGAMGVVYRAFDRKADREAAVKVVRLGSALSAEEFADFRFEARSMARLNHPNVVSVYAYGEVNGEPYFAMELLPRSLGQWLESLGPDRCLRPNRAAELVRDIACGVHHAHLHQLIHRDLKPANVMLDADGHPRVADFGLARRADNTAMTFAGTPLYMAPEQVRGERLTAAADVYALGVILFELLAGRTPFTGSKDSVFKHVLEAPAPGVRSLRPDVDRDLEAICLKCLSKDPDDRYPSAQALVDDLERFLKGEGGIDRRSRVWRAVARSFGRRRETLAMGSWRVAFWGAASTAFALAVIQVAVLLNAPQWVSQAAIGYYLLAWLGLMWYFLVARRDALNPVERASTAIHFGAKFSCVAILPFSCGSTTATRCTRSRCSWFWSA